MTKFGNGLDQLDVIHWAGRPDNPTNQAKKTVCFQGYSSSHTPKMATLVHMWTSHLASKFALHAGLFTFRSEPTKRFGLTCQRCLACDQFGPSTKGQSALPGQSALGWSTLLGFRVPLLEPKSVFGLDLVWEAQGSLGFRSDWGSGGRRESDSQLGGAFLTVAGVVLAAGGPALRQTLPCPIACDF